MSEERWEPFSVAKCQTKITCACVQVSRNSIVDQHWGKNAFAINELRSDEA